METKVKKNSNAESWLSNAIRKHFQLLGHKGLGVTELRTFDPIPMVAYVDNEDDFVGLCLEMEGKTSGIYVGVQPRPAHLFDLAPNRWVRARSGKNGNCARDIDIEYVTALFFDIDVVSEERTKGHPGSEEELLQTLYAAQLLCREDDLVLSSTICCSGNGHYLLAPMVPISIDCDVIGVKFKCFCRQLAERIACQVHGIKFDPVYNLSRVMRVMGTKNCKGQETPERPHRLAHFVTEPVEAKSMAVYHMIRNIEVEHPLSSAKPLPKGIRCDLSKLQNCEFVHWCREHPEQVSEPLWWGLITNLACLEGGQALIHEISKLDNIRYDYSNTERVIQRVFAAGYKPASCQTLISYAMNCSSKGRFQCSRIRQCQAKAPMYMSTLRTIYKVEGD